MRVHSPGRDGIESDNAIHSGRIRIVNTQIRIAVFQSRTSRIQQEPPSTSSLLYSLSLSLMPNDNEYEVSHIVDEDYSNPKQRVFLVRWLGYTSDYDSWEPLENLKDGAIEVIREWDRKNKYDRKRKAKEAKTTVLQRQTKRSSSQSTDIEKETSRRTKTFQGVRRMGKLYIDCRLQDPLVGFLLH